MKIQSSINGETRVSASNPSESSDLGALFDEHVKREFAEHDVDATMETMVPEPCVHCVPTLTDGFGGGGVRRFYSEHLVNQIPEDAKITPISRTVGKDQAVDVFIVSFTHDTQWDYLLPGIPPTGKKVELTHVVVTKFENGKVAHKHAWWDQASLLVQVGLLDPAKLPVTGVEQARKLLQVAKPTKILEASMSTTTNSEPIPVKAPAWAAAIGRINNCIMNDLGGGRRSLKLAWVINFQKLATIPLLGAFIVWYHNTSVAAWIYLSMQSTYGLAWIIKDFAFPDPNFHKRITIGAGVASFVTVLGWYWVFGWLLISGVARPVYPLPDYAWFSLCISLCMLGSVIMIAADAQKYFTLRFKRELITDGMYRFIRHPNYLGEMMTYGSFAMMVWHWLPFVVLALIWGGLFVVNMTLKEARMSRYPEWEQYKKRSWRLLPPVV